MKNKTRCIDCNCVLDNNNNYGDGLCNVCADNYYRCDCGRLVPMGDLCSNCTDDDKTYN